MTESLRDIVIYPAAAVQPHRPSTGTLERQGELWRREDALLGDIERELKPLRPSRQVRHKHK